jgi:hypothetical protein
MNGVAARHVQRIQIALITVLLREGFEGRKRPRSLRTIARPSWTAPFNDIQDDDSIPLTRGAGT